MNHSTSAGCWAAFKGLLFEPFSLLLLAIPAAVALHFLHASEVWVFLFSCLAIIPLAGLMGRATECLAETMGAGLGGLLNATFGNAAELIIAIAILLSARRESPDEQMREAITSRQ